MRLWCWYCHKPVSTELPEDALFRAIAVCPECLEKSPEADNHPFKASHQANPADEKKPYESQTDRHRRGIGGYFSRG